MRFVRRGDEPEKRVAFVAGKRLGGAVVRNRAKRLMREALRRNIDKILRDMILYSLPDLL